MKVNKVTDGITKRALGEMLVIEVDMQKATFQGKSWLSLTAIEKRHYDNLLYLSNVQEGNPKIIYR